MIRIGLMKWKEVSGVMCDREMPVALKDSLQNNHQTSNVMTYGSECWAGKKKDESKMRMLRWARGKARLDHIRNEDIRKEAHVRQEKTKVVWPLHICANRCD